MDAIDMTSVRHSQMRRGLDATRPNVLRTRTQAGFTLIEILVALLILLVGLLGMVGLQAKGQQAEMESYQRTQALVLLQDMINRISANRLDARNLNYVTTSAVGGGGNLTDCSGKSGAALDLCEWGNMLDGAAEATSIANCSSSNGTSCIGAMIGARGCVGYDATTEFTDSTGATLAGTGIYTISIAWLGLIATVSPPAALTCGQNQYVSEAQRRVVTSQIRIAALAAL
jgi:type IV pilus assembly protein PilV